MNALEQARWSVVVPRDLDKDLRVYLAGLRRKLEPDASRPRYFITEPGMGYRFVTTP